MITIITSSRSQEYVIRSEALLGFNIEREDVKNVLSVIIEGVGKVKLGEVKDFEHKTNAMRRGFKKSKG
jgi:hypothetical protein